MKTISTILILFLFHTAKAQIGIGYSIGVFGENMSIINNSSPISISGVNCLKVSSGVLKLLPSSSGIFDNNCIVNLNYTRLNLSLLPNPVINYLIIKLKNKISSYNKFKIGVYNNIGSVSNTFDVNQDELLQGYRIDMSNYITGFYFIVVVSNNIQETFKIFKEK